MQRDEFGIFVVYDMRDDALSIGNFAHVVGLEIWEVIKENFLVDKILVLLQRQIVHFELELHEVHWCRGWLEMIIS